ncbi:MAG: hypothetical protein HY901_30985 [Deltaproteobacteria bacterium]|nr:hypothetical protein [Deltaproteobacteria bacterium]
MSSRRITAFAAALASLLLTAAGLAAEKLPKLPKDSTLPKAARSPGAVVFKHTTHVMPKAPDCTLCHPKMWPIRPGAKKPEIKHRAMEQGEYCGACHKQEKTAIGLDDCDKCHQSE